MKIFKLIFLLMFTILFSCRAFADKGWIDVHFHIVGDKGEKEGFLIAAKRTIGIMDRAGIDKIVLMSPPRPFESFDVDELMEVQKLYGSRINIIGGGGTLNPMLQKAGGLKEINPELKKEFESKAESIVASGAKGFGEIGVHHVSLNHGHGYESIQADHPLLLLLADIAARNNVPIDIHFDPIPEDMKTPGILSSPKNPPELKENITAFERLLAHNRKAKIVWAHAGSDPVGFYTPELVTRLLKKHDNLYCSVRTTHRDNHPMRHPRLGINQEWINVLKNFPDRFVLGTDSFVTTPDYSGPEGPKVFEQRSEMQREGVNQVLSYLDDNLARKIGRENAIKIYNLNE